MGVIDRFPRNDIKLIDAIQRTLNACSIKRDRTASLLDQVEKGRNDKKWSSSRTMLVDNVFFVCNYY